MHIVQSNLLDAPSPLFCEGRKLTGADKALIWKYLQGDPEIPSRLLLNDIAQTHGPIDVSVGHLNKVRKQWELSCPKGRPHQVESGPHREFSGPLIKVENPIWHVGVHLFEDWMEQQNGFGRVVEGLQSGIQTHKRSHPEDKFPLLFHREETLSTRFKAIFYAPLFGIGKLSEFDYKENPLETLLGRGYQSSTLNQFLGQLERIEAGDSLMGALLPTQCGKIGYIDGHLIAYWTSVSIKGKITNVGRIMAGSCAVITHDENGQALFVHYYPPDIRLTPVIVDYCEQISKRTGIVVFVIDREVNALETARAFRDRELGLLCMLDSNQYKGLESFETSLLGSLADGSLVYQGVWKEPKEEDDPRIFVIVKEADRVLVYWGTPKVKEEINPKEWPAVYRRRSEIQENSFKSMMDHGALDVNFGNKKILGPDRHQQRKKDEIEANLAKTRENEEKKAEIVKEKQEKVEESKQKGHKTRLFQRQAGLAKAEEEQNKATKKKEEIEKKLEAVGEDKERADRDFRKQLIMTFRTLFLENALVSYLFALLGHMSGTISLETLLSLFFDRNGSRVETQSQIIYWVNRKGLSLAYQETLCDVVEGINAMGLKREGKPIQVRVRAGPT
jgi:hypothetical protein